MDKYIFDTRLVDAIESMGLQEGYDLIVGILHYAARGEEPHLTGIPKAFFELVRPDIDAQKRTCEISRLRSEARKGKRKKKTS